MDIKKLNDDFAVTGQVFPEQMQEIAGRGYRAIICNRPDNEAPGQPDFATIRMAAQQAGLEVRYIPIVHGAAGLKEFRATEEALQTLPKPILAYCHSGRRSSFIHDMVTESA